MEGLASPFWQFEWYGNSVWEYTLAVIGFIVLVILLRILKTFLTRWLGSISERTDNEIDNAIYQVLNTIKPQFYWFVSFYFAIQLLDFADQARRVVRIILVMWVTYQVIIALQIFIDYFIERKVKASDDHGKEVVAGIASGISRIVLWSLAILFVLSNVGVNITSLIAGLGIGGIAVALAAQSVLGDLFSSLAIYFDRPFEVGDYIVSGEVSGTVKKVGIKTTRIKALSGEEIVVPNKNITDSRIKNYKRMTERRVSMELGVEYSTPHEKMKEIPSLIQAIIERTKDLRFSRVHFKAFGDSALIFEVIYHVESKEYDLYMDRQQEVLLGIKEMFEQQNIRMAFPTQTVHLIQKTDA
ncbi:MAG: mechanosensitive ion channel family protein [Candidatus Andersenbacteria bacterium]